MSFFNKNFFAGMAAGMLTTVVVISAGIGVGGYFVMKGMPGVDIAGSLQGPNFPTEQQLSSYGKASFAPALQTLGGETVSMSKFEGQVVFLNVWATWCKPCVAELPGIQRLSESFKDQPVAFLLVTEEEIDHVKKFMSSANLTIPTFLWQDPPAVFKTHVLPTTFIMDRDGNIVFHHVGAANWDDEACRAFLTRLAGSGQLEE
jgi:thiol-disulfide isomerase/thioredoxin